MEIAQHGSATKELREGAEYVGSMAIKAHRGSAPPSLVVPPVQFRLCELDTTRPGTRALDTFEHVYDQPPNLVWLAHVQGSRGVRVGSAAAGSHDLAQTTAGCLVDMVTPVDIHRPILRRVRELVSSADAWSEAVWFVGGQEMRASVWRFAGGWAGFVSADVEVDVMAVGVAVEPKISVRAVTSSESYDVDLFDSLSIFIPGARKRRRPLTVMPNPNKDAPHPDHKRLLSH